MHTFAHGETVHVEEAVTTSGMNHYIFSSLILGVLVLAAAAHFLVLRNRKK